MSYSFTKLFSSITESTIWAEPAHVKIIWITMLAKADRKGRVSASIPGLANLARCTMEETHDALEKLMSPDKYSRTQENEGRRIEEIRGGWRLLNHTYYRNLQDEEQRREYKRKWAAENRHKGVDKKSTDVDKSGQKSTQAEAEAEAEADKPKNKKASIKDLILPEWLNKEAWAEFVAHRKEIRKPLSLLAGKKALNMLEGLEPKMQQQCIDRTIQSGWAGIFPRNEDKPNETAQRATTRPESNHGRVMRQLREASASS